jgi:hypothetical protein
MSSLSQRNKKDQVNALLHHLLQQTGDILNLFQQQQPKKSSSPPPSPEKHGQDEKFKGQLNSFYFPPPSPSTVHKIQDDLLNNPFNLPSHSTVHVNGKGKGHNFKQLIRASSASSASSAQPGLQPPQLKKKRSVQVKSQTERRSERNKRKKTMTDINVIFSEMQEKHQKEIQQQVNHDFKTKKDFMTLYKSYQNPQIYVFIIAENEQEQLKTAFLVRHPPGTHIDDILRKFKIKHPTLKIHTYITKDDSGEVHEMKQQKKSSASSFKIQSQKAP